MAGRASCRGQGGRADNGKSPIEARIAAAEPFTERTTAHDLLDARPTNTQVNDVLRLEVD